MKKLLILAYDFPPYVSVGGLRPYSWYRYMKEFGVEPIVVTRQWENKYGNELDYISPSASKETMIENTEYGTIIKAPFKPSLSNKLLLRYGENRFRYIRKALTAWDEIRQYFYISGPKKTIYKEAKKYLKENKVDAIIATGSPFVLFFYASKLSGKFKIPWIADYRDPWSQARSRSKGVFNKLNKYLEPKFVKTASFATSVPSVIETIKLGIENVSVLPIANGYDDELIDQFRNSKQTADVLTISHIGSLYVWHPWKQFLDNYRDYIVLNRKKLRLKFYGVNRENEIKKHIENFPEEVKNSIVFIPRMQNVDLLRSLANDNVMLLFNYYFFDGTKIYDYLGLKRKILFCFENDKKALKLKSELIDISKIPNNHLRPQVEVLNRTNGGVIVKDEIHLNQVLDDLHEEFSNHGFIRCNSKNEVDYSRKKQTQKLAELILII